MSLRLVDLNSRIAFDDVGGGLPDEDKAEKLRQYDLDTATHWAVHLVLTRAQAEQAVRMLDRSTMLEGVLRGEAILTTLLHHEPALPEDDGDVILHVYFVVPHEQRHTVPAVAETIVVWACHPSVDPDWYLTLAVDWSLHVPADWNVLRLA
jgi:hypothetical protein